MDIKTIHNIMDAIGVLTFSTQEKGEVQSRVAHLNGWDDQGIYFRTMGNKPFGRQLKATGKVTICGMSDSRILGHTEEGVPEFPPGHFVRLVAEVDYIEADEIRRLAVGNKALQLAVHDIDKYPMMGQGNFRIVRAKGEIYDYDFDCLHRDHKLLRKRFSFGGMAYNEAGPRINEGCTGCGLCKEVCSFKAIEAGQPFKINPQKCDDCGSCIHVCPSHAIDLSKAL